MMTLLHQLESHDWFYAYSDDHRVWSAGSREGRRLGELIDSLDCPHSIEELRRAVQGYVVEDFAEEEPGKWYKQPKMYDCIAPTMREELMTRSEQAVILAWIEDQTN